VDGRHRLARAHFLEGLKELPAWAVPDEILEKNRLDDEALKFYEITPEELEEYGSEKMLKVKKAAAELEAAQDTLREQAEKYRKDYAITMWMERRRDTPKWFLFEGEDGLPTAKVRLENNPTDCIIEKEVEGTPEQMRKLDEAARKEWLSYENRRKSDSGSHLEKSAAAENVFQGHTFILGLPGSGKTTLGERTV
jgi:hypothetical protein